MDDYSANPPISTLPECGCGGEPVHETGTRQERYPFYVMCRRCGIRTAGSAFRNDVYNEASWARAMGSKP